MDIAAGDTYSPRYVKLRLIGCQRLGLPLVSTHTGSTAASRHGCDPAVVPTLVDHQSAETVIDSRIICRHVDETVPEELRLLPTAMASTIDEEIAIVDDLPNYQMLVGSRGDDDRRPQSLQARDGANFSLSKVARCDRHIEQACDDAGLVAAYQAKRAKELEAAHSLFSPSAVGDAHRAVEAACIALDTRLSRRGSDWLFGSRLTMADLFWAVALIRIENLGSAIIWSDERLPALARFHSRATQLDSIRKSILCWPVALW